MDHLLILQLTYYLSSCKSILILTNFPTRITTNSKGKVSIRRNNLAISCSEIASNLAEGGGHDYAAGAKFTSNPSDTAAVIGELEAAVVKATASR